MTTNRRRGVAVRRVSRGRSHALALVAVLLTLAGGTAGPLAAQVSVEVPEPGEALYEVGLRDGTEVVGRVREVTPSSIVIETPGGARLKLERSQLASIRRAGGRVVEGRYWHRDRNDTRLYFSSTGRSLAAGEGYVGTYVLFLPFVGVGLSDRFTLAAGAPVLFGDFEPFYIAPKLQVVRSDAVSVSAGTLAFFFKDETVGIAYGVGTFGSRDRALHLGVGFGYAGDDFSEEPVAMLGGELRVSPRVKLLTENYILPHEVGAVYSFGLRLIGERLSVDLGLAGLTDEGDDGAICCLPLVNFSYAFGNGR